MYFLFVVVRIVAVIRHRVHGNLVSEIGWFGGMTLGLGLIGKRSVVLAAYVCLCGPDFLGILARNSLFRIWVWRRVVKNLVAISRLVSLRMLVITL